MSDSDKIMKMLDWNNDEEIQRKGRELAASVQEISLFLQPVARNYNKNVWGNCAKILSDKDDEELKPYLFQMFEWIQDMNWPGSEVIFERLVQYKRRDIITEILNQCIKEASKGKDELWLNNLYEFNVVFSR